MAEATTLTDEDRRLLEGAKFPSLLAPSLLTEEDRRLLRGGASERTDEERLLGLVASGMRQDEAISLLSYTRGDPQVNVESVSAGEGKSISFSPEWWRGIPREALRKATEYAGVKGKNWGNALWRGIQMPGWASVGALTEGLMPYLEGESEGLARSLWQGAKTGLAKESSFGDVLPDDMRIPIAVPPSLGGGAGQGAEYLAMQKFGGGVPEVNVKAPVTLALDSIVDISNLIDMPLKWVKGTFGLAKIGIAKLGARAGVATALHAAEMAMKDIPIRLPWWKGSLWDAYKAAEDRKFTEQLKDVRQVRTGALEQGVTQRLEGIDDFTEYFMEDLKARRPTMTEKEVAETEAELMRRMMEYGETPRILEQVEIIDRRAADEKLRIKGQLASLARDINTLNSSPRVRSARAEITKLEKELANTAAPKADAEFFRRSGHAKFVKRMDPRVRRLEELEVRLAELPEEISRAVSAGAVGWNDLRRLTDERNGKTQAAEKIRADIKAKPWNIDIRTESGWVSGKTQPVENVSAEREKALMRIGELKHVIATQTEVQTIRLRDLQRKDRALDRPASEILAAARSELETRLGPSASIDDFLTGREPIGDAEPLPLELRTRDLRLDEVERLQNRLREIVREKQQRRADKTITGKWWMYDELKNTAFQLDVLRAEMRANPPKSDIGEGLNVHPRDIASGGRKITEQIEGYADRVFEEWKHTGNSVWRSDEIGILLRGERAASLSNMLETYGISPTADPVLFTQVAQRFRKAMSETEAADMAFGLALHDVGILNADEVSKYLVSGKESMHVRHQYVRFMQDWSELDPNGADVLNDALRKRGVFVRQRMKVPKAIVTERVLDMDQLKRQLLLGGIRDYRAAMMSGQSSAARGLAVAEWLKRLDYHFAKSPEDMATLLERGAVRPVSDKRVMRQVLEELKSPTARITMTRAEIDEALTAGIQGYTLVPLEKAYGELAGKFVSNHILEDLEWFRRVPSESAKTWANLISGWKWLKVPTNPSAIAHNLVGNMMLAHWGAGVSPLRLDLWMRAAGEVSNKGAHFQELSSISPIFRDTMMREEFQGLMRAVNRSDSKNLATTISSTLESSWDKVKGITGNFYEFQEQWAKMAVYMRGVEEMGLSPEAAGKLAEKWVFNYRKVPRIVELASRYGGMPFVRFQWKMANVLPEAALTKTGRMSQYPKLWRTLFADEQPDESIERPLIPDWMAGGWKRTSWRRKDGKPLYVNFTNILPGMELMVSASDVRTPQGVAREVTGIPIISSVFALAANRDMYTGLPIFDEEPMTGRVIDDRLWQKATAYVAQREGFGIARNLVNLFKSAKVEPMEVIAETLKRDYVTIEEYNRQENKQAEGFYHAAQEQLKEVTGGRDASVMRTPLEASMAIFGISTKIVDVQKNANHALNALDREYKRLSASTMPDKKIRMEVVDLQRRATADMLVAYLQRLRKWHESKGEQHPLISTFGNTPLPGGPQ